MNLDFSDIKVLLIGDFMIDHYVIGNSNRMSPEAPVPVVIPENEYFIPGGAGNVAMNLSKMGSKVTCMGAVGHDTFGESLVKELNKNNVNTEFIEVIPDHITTLKQRIYCNGTQIARVDKEKLLRLSPNSLKKINYTDYDIIILSDYNKGTLMLPWFFKPKGINVILDPKNKSWEHLFIHSNIITPNINELEVLSEIAISNNDSILIACNKLIEEKNFDYVIAKKGDQGITIVGKQKFVKNIDPFNVENPDVTGAGDTVIAALSVAYAKTNDIEFSSKFANAAAANVVGKVGTAAANIRQIKELLVK